MSVIILFAILGFVGFLVLRKLVGNYRVNRVIYSDHGRRYLELLEQTGIAADRHDIDRLAELVIEREEIHAKAREEGYDLNLIDDCFISRFGMKPDQLLLRDIEFPSDEAEPSGAKRHSVGSASEGPQGFVEELHICGRNGIEILRKTIEDLRPQLRSLRNDERLRLQYFLHAHALVWYAVSLAIPVEEGAKIWTAHLELMRKDLAKQGFGENIVDGLEPAIRQVWLRYAKCKERGSNPATAHYHIILEDLLGSPKDIVVMFDVASVVYAIMAPCRCILERKFPEYFVSRCLR